MRTDIGKLRLLITPHGDLKPGKAGGVRWTPYELITPHGDLKRPLRGGMLASRPTHYPSWGFETCLPCPIARSRLLSLPLMGI